MKTRVSIVVALFVLALGSVASAQGTINFANGTAGVNAPVRFADTQEPVAGPDWMAQLFRVTPTGQAAVGAPVPMGQGATAGYFLGGARDVLGIDPGASTGFRVQVYNLYSGA